MKTKLIIAMASTLSLAACGGGGSGSSPAAPTPTPTSYYTPNAVKAGDTYSYSQTSTSNNGVVTTAPYSLQVSTVSNNGNYYLTNYNASNTSVGGILVDVNHNALSTSSGCTYSSPLNVLPYPWFVGQTGSQSVTETCPIAGQTGSQIFDIQESSNVESYQTTTVPAGTFNTLKILHTYTYSNGTGTAQSIYPFTESTTCWDDVVTGLEVQCNGSYTYTPAVTTPTVVISSYTNELESMSNASTTAFALTGSDFGIVIPWLYLTPSEITSLNASGNRDIVFNTTQPVTWTIIVNGNPTVVSSLDQSISYNGLIINTSATSTSITSKTNGASLASAVSYTVQARLIADPTKVVTVNITNNP